MCVWYETTCWLSDSSSGNPRLVPPPIDELREVQVPQSDKPEHMCKVFRFTHLTNRNTSAKCSGLYFKISELFPYVFRFVLKIVISTGTLKQTVPECFLLFPEYIIKLFRFVFKHTGILIQSVPECVSDQFFEQ